MKIAVDFDGTIVEHKYPQIGKEQLFAFETLKQLSKQKHQLILWTYRAGRELDEAVEYCRENGVEFFAVNYFLLLQHLQHELVPITTEIMIAK